MILTEREHLVICTQTVGFDPPPRTKETTLEETETRQRKLGRHNACVLEDRISCVRDTRLAFSGSSHFEISALQIKQRNLMISLFWGKVDNAKNFEILF